MINFINSLNFSLKANLSIHILLPAALFITMLPHLHTITPIFSLFIIINLSWFALHTLSVFHLPGKLIRFMLVILALFLLLMNFGVVFSQKASLTLLCIMSSLKLLEIRNERDKRNIFLVIFLAYFILVTHFLYSQDFLLSLFSLFSVLVLTLLLAGFNRKPQNMFSLNESIHLLASLFLKALPMAIVLFLFFPRIPGPLWSLPDSGQTGSTGLSDKMYPGSVSELRNSEEIAFRVNFHTQDHIPATPPASDKLYWRGPVLSETDGFLWSQKKQTSLNSIGKSFNTIIKNSSQTVFYTITLEPHHKKWLFALEMPKNIDGDTIRHHYLTNDLQLLNKNNIDQLTQYQVTSLTQFTFNQVTSHELDDNLYFPELTNPKTQSLGQQWRKTIDDDEKIVSTALNYFKNNPFYYTTQPELMIDNPADQFLFDKKRGFCEHFASSFVLLMRAAHIPSRVVTGYQGIEKNDIGNYFIVRQSNAHAWAEVWLDTKGWLRVDPTAMIPPERIEADIFNTNLERLSYSSLNIPNLSKLSLQQKTTIYKFWRQINQSIDSMKYRWNNWILGYDQSKQELLLTLMGLNPDWQTLIFLLIAGMIAVLLLLQLLSYYQRLQKIDKTYHNYLKFLKKLNSAGLAVQLSDAPDDIKHQALTKFPQQKKNILAIMDSYIQIRYARQTDKQLMKQQIKQFIHQIKGFHL